jgi:hypothetical protein
VKSKENVKQNKVQRMSNVLEVSTDFKFGKDGIQIALGLWIDFYFFNVAQASLKLQVLLLSASRVLELPACVTMLRSKLLRV